MPATAAPTPPTMAPIGQRKSPPRAAAPHTTAVAQSAPVIANHFMTHPPLPPPPQPP